MPNAPPQPNAEDWLARHGDVLYRYALRHTRARDEAEDLVQETLLAAWRGHDGFRRDASERTWLIGILKHKLADRARQKARSREEADADSDEALESRVFRANGTWQEPPGRWGRNPLDDAQSDAFLAALNHCLEGMPENQRESFVLRELTGMDAAAAGRTLGVTVNNLYVLLHRARLRLRRCLEHTWFAREDGPS